MTGVYLLDAMHGDRSGEPSALNWSVRESELGRGAHNRKVTLLEDLNNILTCLCKHITPIQSPLTYLVHEFSTTLDIEVL